MSPTRVTIRSVPAGHGADWISEGYRWFREAPGPWIGAFLVLALLVYVASRGGQIVQLAGDLVLPVLTGGLMLGCEAQARREPFRFTHLFSGFEQPLLTPLLLLGLLSIVGIAVVALGVIAALGATVAGALVGGGIESLELGPSVLILLIVALLLIAPLAMALWFAPALVAVYRLGPAEAMLASLRAGRRNPGAMLVNGLLLTLMAIVATIPLGLGWLIAGPVLFASIHAGCRDLFEVPPAVAHQAEARSDL